LCLRPHEGTVLVLKIEVFFVRNLVCVFCVDMIISSNLIRLNFKSHSF
jgi:hypothetical protein